MCHNACTLTEIVETEDRYIYIYIHEMMNDRYTDIICIIILLYHNANLTVICLSVCVCESGRSWETIRPELKTSLYLESCSWDTTPNTKESTSQKPLNKVRLKNRLTCGSPVTAQELDSVLCTGALQREAILF